MLFRTFKLSASFFAFALASILTFASSPATAQRLPSQVDIEIIVKRSLSTFNDANVNDNYDVLHASMSRPFRAQFTVERLRDAFKSFRDRLIDISPLLALKPVLSEPVRFDQEGALLVKGTFETRPGRVLFDLRFLAAEANWKMLAIRVETVPVDNSSGAASGQMR